VRRSVDVRLIVMAVLAALPLHASAQQATTNKYGNPLKHAPRPTSAAIDVADLRTRLYIFADDSMQGRQVGRVGSMKANAYIARELARLGVEPGGDDGTYYQAMPFILRKYHSNSALSVEGTAMRWLDDFVAVPGAAPPRPIQNVQVVYGGVSLDTVRLISAEQAAGKFVVLSPAPPGQGRGGRGGGGRAGGPPQGPSPATVQAQRLQNAAAVATVDLHTLNPAQRKFINDRNGQFVNPQPQPARAGAPPAQAPAAGGRGQAPLGPAATLRITPEAANQLFGRPYSNLEPGATGRTVSANLLLMEQPVPDYARNVIGIIRGSDPALRGQFIAVGAHPDHVGYNASPVDHDSARAYASADLAMRIVGNELRDSLTTEQRANLRVNVDSLRRIRAARRDSISNGADDDGSGSMAALEIAEAFARAPVKPKRSIIFVWHNSEEAGLTGSRWFVEHPTVPRDSIVAQINMDMIGRGRAEDIAGGGEDYLAVVGSKMLSTELGEAVTAVNQKQQRPLKLDYRFDEPTTWPGYNNIYNRSDHANYARHNIPIAFFFTGLHMDYHRVTDEPQYIDYPHYARITNYVRDLVVEIANRPNRLRVDKARPIS
jgi:hypothetical protein